MQPRTCVNAACVVYSNSNLCKPHACINAAYTVYSTNMSSASTSVNNRGSLWEEDEIKALITVLYGRDQHIGGTRVRVCTCGQR